MVSVKRWLVKKLLLKITGGFYYLFYPYTLYLLKSLSGTYTGNNNNNNTNYDIVGKKTAKQQYPTVHWNTLHKHKLHVNN